MQPIMTGRQKGRMGGWRATNEIMSIRIRIRNRIGRGFLKSNLSSLAFHGTARTALSDQMGGTTEWHLMSCLHPEVLSGVNL